MQSDRSAGSLGWQGAVNGGAHISFGPYSRPLPVFLYISLHRQTIDSGPTGLIPNPTTPDIVAVQNCEVCCQGKMAQLPHRKVGEGTEACHKMDRIHIDLVGPLAVPSAHGEFSYFQSGMEVGCRLSIVNLLKVKSDALSVSKVTLHSYLCSV